MTATPGKILILEDSMDSRLLLARALRLENYEVLMAADGFEALKTLEAHRDIHLILMDFMMPVMNAEDFLRRLREKPEYAEIKVILVSGWDRLSQKAKELGVEGHLSKPIDLDELHTEVARHFPMIKKS